MTYKSMRIEMRIRNSQERGWLFRYGLALVFVAIAIGMRYALNPLLGVGYQYVTIYPAIVIVAILAGRNAAVLNAVFSSITAEYLFEPTMDFHSHTAVIIVIASGVLIGHLTQRLNDALMQAKAETEIRKQAEQQQIELKNILQDKVKELESIISVVSHDLRAPLISIRGFNDALKEDCKVVQELLSVIAIPDGVQTKLDKIFNKSVPEAEGYIETSAKSMNDLIESLVKVARAGLVVPNPEVLDINQIMKDVIDSIRIKVKDTGAIIDVENLPNCFADKTHVMQIFSNLVDNALKYLEPTRPGEIKIDGLVEGNNSIYRVCDNGIGILKGDEEKVFDIFYRSKGTAAKGEGIGLATVKRLVERNNGRIWIDCEKDKGCNFFVALPLPDQRPFTSAR